MSEPTVLSMINTNLGDISTDVKEIKRDMKSGAVKMENHEVRLGTVEKHIDDPKIHYNPYYSESIPQKLWRKKPEIAAGGGLGTVIVGIIIALLSRYGVI